MTTRKTLLEYFPEKLRNSELVEQYSKVTEFIVEDAYEQLQDVKFKASRTGEVRQEVVEEIIRELGFGYISSIVEEITDFEYSILLDFLSFLNILKGTRAGVEVILKLLGFEAIVEEWWEQEPIAEPMTFIITIFMDNSTVTDPFVVIEKIKIFLREYVYAVFENANLVFEIEFAEANTAHAGFIDQETSINIEGSI
jgi:uncharacterized protein (DUF433 family)